jgi:hypothetical protein
MMLELICRRDLAKMGIRNWEGGLNITAFLDHLEACEKCRAAQGTLIGELNIVIGGETEKVLRGNETNCCSRLSVPPFGSVFPWDRSAVYNLARLVCLLLLQRRLH